MNFILEGAGPSLPLKGLIIWGSPCNFVVLRRRGNDYTLDTFAHINQSINVTSVAMKRELMPAIHIKIICVV
jgi:hypothetical protein